MALLGMRGKSAKGGVDDKERVGGTTNNGQTLVESLAMF
jgi:hypothetical protein